MCNLHLESGSQAKAFEATERLYLNDALKKEYSSLLKILTSLGTLTKVVKYKSSEISESIYQTIKGSSYT